MPVAGKLGANINYVINAYANGDLVTNLLQPFWALPIIGAFKGVTFRNILFYSLVMCAGAFLVIIFTYLVFLN